MTGTLTRPQRPERPEGASHRASAAGPVISDEHGAEHGVRSVPLQPPGEERATKPVASPAARSRKGDQGDGASGTDRSEDRPDRSGGEGSRARSTGTTPPADRTGRRPRGGGAEPLL